MRRSTGYSSEIGRPAHDGKSYTQTVLGATPLPPVGDGPAGRSRPLGLAREPTTRGSSSNSVGCYWTLRRASHAAPTDDSCATARANCPSSTRYRFSLPTAVAWTSPARSRTLRCLATAWRLTGSCSPSVVAVASPRPAGGRASGVVSDHRAQTRADRPRAWSQRSSRRQREPRNVLRNPRDVEVPAA
jgi:hypothetical protein